MKIRGRTIAVIVSTNFIILLLSILVGMVAFPSKNPARNFDGCVFRTIAVSLTLNVVAAAVASRFIKKPFEELEALREAAEADSQAKSHFLAHMSHEIRTPLNAVVGLSELALNGDGLEDEMETRLQNIRSSGMTILGIVNDILDISKMESGQFVLSPIQYDVPNLLNDVMTVNVAHIGEKPVTFRLRLDEDLPCALYGDDLRIKQIFDNLLSNAFKYTDSGVVEWRVTFTEDPEGVWLVSSVKDTGIGVKPENLSRLFSDYSQIIGETTRKIEGAGLGLVITKRLVEMMDGTITVESEYGRGSTFYVRLRQTRVTDVPIGGAVAKNLMNRNDAPPKPDANAKLVRLDLSYAHVLVVDDIMTNLDVVKGMMKPYGLKVDCAINGRQALEMVRIGNPRYQAIFMDYMMPEMDGVEAAHAIRGIGTRYAQTIPIIALTANALVGNRAMFLEQGFQDFISKPIDIMELDAVLRRFVRDKDLGGDRWEDGGDEEETHLPDDGDYPFPSIDGIDARRALERFGGDATALIDVLLSYATHTKRLILNLQEYLMAENLTDYAVTTHRIKAASYALFAEEVGNMAKKLESAAMMRDIDGVRAGHAAFVLRTETLLNLVVETFGAFGESADKPRVPVPDPAFLRELYAACEAFDMDGVDAAMTQLESFQYESGGELVTWLREQVNDMVFEEIIARLQALAENQGVKESEE